MVNLCSLKVFPEIFTRFYDLLGRKEVVDMLIEDGAKMDLVDVNNNTALELAETNGN